MLGRGVQMFTRPTRRHAWVGSKSRHTSKTLQNQRLPPIWLTFGTFLASWKGLAWHIMLPLHAPQSTPQSALRIYRLSLAGTSLPIPCGFRTGAQVSRWIWVKLKLHGCFLYTAPYYSLNMVLISNEAEFPWIPWHAALPLLDPRNLCTVSSQQQLNRFPLYQDRSVSPENRTIAASWALSRVVQQDPVVKPRSTATVAPLCLWDGNVVQSQHISHVQTTTPPKKK